VVFLAEYQASFKELEEEEGGRENAIFLSEALEEGVEGSNEGEMLVIRRALHGIASQ